MLQYQEVRPRINMMGGPGGPWRAPGMRGGPDGPGHAWWRPAAERRLAGASASGVSVPAPRRCARRMESMPPPQPSTVTLYLGDYKKVDGVMLPHRLTQAVEGKTGRGMDDREGQGQSVGQGRSLREEVVPSDDNMTATSRSFRQLLVASRTAWCCCSPPAAAAQGNRPCA